MLTSHKSEFARVKHLLEGVEKTLRSPKEWEEWLRHHHPVYLRDGTRGSWTSDMQVFRESGPYVLMWSSRGEGWLPASDTSSSHIGLEDLVGFFKQGSSSRWPRVIFVMHKYGARLTAERLYKECNNKCVIVWVRKEISKVADAKALHLLRAIDVLQTNESSQTPEMFEREIRAQKKAGMFVQAIDAQSQHDSILGVFQAQNVNVRVPNIVAGLDIDCKIVEVAENNLKDTQAWCADKGFLSCDIDIFNRLLSHFSQAMAGSNSQNMVHMRAHMQDERKRCCSIARQLCMYFLYEFDVDLVLHVASKDDLLELQERFTHRCDKGKYAIVWIELEDSCGSEGHAMFEPLRTFFGELAERELDDEKDTLVLITRKVSASKGDSSQATDKQDVALRKALGIRDPKVFSIEPYSKPAVPADTVHAEIQIKMFRGRNSTSCSPSDILGQDSWNILEQCLKHILPSRQDTVRGYMENVFSAGGAAAGADSEGRVREDHQPIAAMYLDDDDKNNISVFVRICLGDICYLNVLRDTILMGTFEIALQDELVAKTKSQLLVVKADKTELAQMYILTKSRGREETRGCCW
jgi:hypothetical protein